MNGDAGAAAGEIVHANDFGEVVAIEGAGFGGIGEGDEEAGVRGTN
jgi:hypothetical protein